MEMYYIIVFFIIGTVLGSFYNVVGYRVPKGESILFPSSHCTNCNHRLRPWELIPIISFLLQGAKCTKCKQKISWFYPIFEFSCGVLFALSFWIFGFSKELLIVLTFISMLIIVVLSDYYYMIIPDEVIIVFSIMLLLEILIMYGFNPFLNSLLGGIISFVIMFILKKFGDWLFKKESMGGGDIKLMFVFGLVLGWPMAIVSIFLASIVGLPISLIIMLRKNTHIIPFGPFLSLGALIIVLTKIDINWIINILTHRM